MSAFGTLIGRYEHRFFNALLRMVGNYDDAQELAQESFVRAMQGLKRFRGNSAFYTWLYRIGFNLAINHCRRNQRVKLCSIERQNGAIGGQASVLNAVADPNAVSPLVQTQVNEMHERVLAAIEALDEQFRAVVVLRDIEQLDYAQIAAILEVPVGTVKSRLFRARMALRKELAEKQGSQK